MRDQFLNDILVDVYDRVEWEWAKTNATIPVVNSIASLPSSVRQEGVKDVREILTPGSDNIYQLVEYRDFDAYNTDSHVFRLLGNAEQGTYQAQLSSTLASVASIYFVQKAPVLANVSDFFPVPNGAMVVARGALMYYRLQQDPQADVTPESQAYETEILKLIQMENRDRPKKRAISLSEYLRYPGTGGLPSRFGRG